MLTIQAEDGFPLDRLPELPMWDVHHYGRNLLLFRVKGETMQGDENSSI